MTFHDLSTGLWPIVLQAFAVCVFSVFAVLLQKWRGVLPDQTAVLQERDDARKDQEQAMTNLRAYADSLKLRLDEQDKEMERMRQNHQREIDQLRTDLAAERTNVHQLTIKLTEAQTALAQAATSFLNAQGQPQRGATSDGKP